MSDLENSTRRKQKTIVKHGGANPTNCYHAVTGTVSIETGHMPNDDDAAELHAELEEVVMSVIEKHAKGDNE